MEITTIATQSMHCSTIRNSIAATASAANGITAVAAKTNRIRAIASFKWLAATAAVKVCRYRQLSRSTLSIEIVN